MQFSFANLVNSLAVAGLAALGGAIGVYAEFDDAPGGVLIGMLLIIGAVALGARAAQRREEQPQARQDRQTKDG